VVEAVHVLIDSGAMSTTIGDDRISRYPSFLQKLLVSFKFRLSATGRFLRCFAPRADFVPPERQSFLDGSINVRTF